MHKVAALVPVALLLLSAVGCDDPAGPRFVGAGLGSDPFDPPSSGDYEGEPDDEEALPLLDLGTADETETETDSETGGDGDDETTGDGDGDGDGDDEPPPDVECMTHDDCGALDSACSIGICGVGGECEALPVNDGDACSTGDACIVGETCSAGECVGGAPVDCSGFDDQCHVGACDPDSGECVAEYIDGCVTIEPGDLVFTEIMPNPGACADENCEWIEIQNVSGQAIDVSGLVIECAHDVHDGIVIGELPPVGPGEHVWLGGFMNAWGYAAQPDDFYNRSDLPLSNFSEALTLLAGDDVIDSINLVYANYVPADSLVFSFTGGRSLQRDAGGDWCVAASNPNWVDYGSPGAANHDCP